VWAAAMIPYLFTSLSMVVSRSAGQNGRRREHAAGGSIQAMVHPSFV
jgi:hypothetical protein